MKATTTKKNVKKPRQRGQAVGSSRRQQLQFINASFKGRAEHGGSALKSNPKSKRPLDRKKAVHLVLKSRFSYASRVLLKGGRGRVIEAIIRKQARTFGVKIYKYANAGNHLHILIRAGNRKGFNGFIRAVTGLIARLVLGAQRGHSNRGRSLWLGRPWSRVVEWGKAYKWAFNYLQQNYLEAFGFVAYRPRVYGVGPPV